MHENSPEFRRPTPRIVSIGQEFPLFPPGEDPGFILDLEGAYKIPYKPYLSDYRTHASCSKLDTLTPFNPEMGYRVTHEDLDPQKRLEKIRNLLKGKNIQDDMLLPDLKTLTIYDCRKFDRGEKRVIEDPNFNEDYFLRLALLLKIKGQMFVGLPLVDGQLPSAISAVDYPSFVPADLGRAPAWNDEIRYLEDDEGCCIADVGFWGTGFKLGVPAGKIPDIQARFYLSPTPVTESQSPTR